MKPTAAPSAARSAAASAAASAATVPWSPVWQAQVELARLQAEWSAGQWLQWTGWCERGLALALDAQRAWLQRLEAGTAQALDGGADRPGVAAPAAANGHAVFELMEQPNPATLLRDAQQAWQDIGAAWLGAIRHDLREEAAAP